MDLQQTIEELERQARQYRQAADQLRALTTNGISASGAASQLTTVQKTRGGNTSETGTSPGKARKDRKTKQVSAETRAKISEKLKAAHAARKAAASTATSAASPVPSSENVPAPA